MHIGEAVGVTARGRLSFAISFRRHGLMEVTTDQSGSLSAGVWATCSETEEMTKGDKALPLGNRII